MSDSVSNTGLAFYTLPEAKHWRCARGHSWSGLPFFLTFALDGRAAATTKPLCLLCLAAHLDAEFSASEASATA